MFGIEGTWSLSSCFGARWMVMAFYFSWIIRWFRCGDTLTTAPGVTDRDFPVRLWPPQSLTHWSSQTGQTDCVCVTYKRNYRLTQRKIKSCFIALHYFKCGCTYREQAKGSPGENEPFIFVLDVKVAPNNANLACELNSHSVCVWSIPPVLTQLRRIALRRQVFESSFLT